MSSPAIKMIDPTDNSIIDLGLATLRQMAWDAMPCSEVEHVIRDMGMLPASKEVSDKEHKASHDRIEKLLGPIFPYIQMASENLTKIHIAAALHGHNHEIPEVVKTSVEETHKRIILSSLMSAFSTALDLGIIKAEQ